MAGPHTGADRGEHAEDSRERGAGAEEGEAADHCVRSEKWILTKLERCWWDSVVAGVISSASGIVCNGSDAHV